MLLRIKPMRVGKYIEPCMLEIKGEQKDSEFYPVAVVHVDNFWQGREGGNQVYNLLQSEKVVEIEISLTPRALDLPNESVCICGKPIKNHQGVVCLPESASQ